MMRQRSYALLALLLCAGAAFGQISFNNGQHSLEISGGISTYFNYRWIKPDAGNQALNKNRFRLRDAQLQIEGRIGQDWEYELQMDFADLGQGGASEFDPENPGLMDAYIIYRGLGFLDIQLGYGKTPYAFSSLVPIAYSPYWQRAQIVRGDVFSRRDVGLTLSKTFWQQRATVYAGIYNGIGEISLRGDNDDSGAFEYMARAEVAWPSRFRYREIDDRLSPIPLFALGLNGRYTRRNLPEGGAFPSFSSGEYGLKVFDGERYIYGLDAHFMYQGFSAAFEIHQMLGRPSNDNDVLLQGIDPLLSEGYFLMGGYLAQVNYFAKPLRSIFSLRYEQLDLNDLVAGRSERLSAAYAYQINGYNSMIKVQYFNILAEEAIDPLRWNEQIRIGWQLMFR